MGRVSGFVLPIGVALVVLMFATLAVLTFSTARADNNFAKRNIQYNEMYYRTVGRFEAVLSESAQMFEEASDVEEFKKRIAHIEELEVISEETDAVELVFQKEVTEFVVFRAHYFLRKKENVQIVSRGTINLDEWQEQKMDVWRGSEDGYKNNS